MDTRFLRDRDGREIYLTEERWQHIIDGHPELRGHLEDVLQTIRLGRRQQQPQDPQTYGYRRLCATLQPPFNGILVSVAFRFAEGAAGVTIANNFVVTPGESLCVVEGEKMYIERGELALSSGQKAAYEFEPETDLLEIFFQQGEATGAVELTESIILRFDWESEKPMSLSLISASKLVKPTVYGEPNYQLLEEEWPDRVQEKVWRMLRTFPLNELMIVRSYAPAHAPRAVPMATIKPLVLAALGAVAAD